MCSPPSPAHCCSCSSLVFPGHLADGPHCKLTLLWPRAQFSCAHGARTLLCADLKLPSLSTHLRPHTAPSRSTDGLWVSRAISSSAVFPSSVAKSRALAESAETWWTPGQVFGYKTCSLPTRPKCSSSFPQEVAGQQAGPAEELTPLGALETGLSLPSPALQQDRPPTTEGQALAMSPTDPS